MAELDGAGGGPPGIAAGLAAMRRRDVVGELADAMGIEVVDWTPDRMVATMPVAGNRQPYGLLHGGASCVLAEAVGSIAAALHAEPDRFPVGVELNASHHRPATAGVVTAVCTPLHIGRSMATFAVELSDDQGRRTCSARLTCAYLRRRPEQHGLGPGG